MIPAMIPILLIAKMYSISLIVPTFSTDTCKQAYEVEQEILGADYLPPRDKQELLNRVFRSYPECYINTDT